MLLEHVASICISVGIVAALLPILSFQLFVTAQAGTFRRETKTFIRSGCWCSLSRSLLPDGLKYRAARIVDDIFGVLRADAASADRHARSDASRLILVSSITSFVIAFIATVLGVGILTFSSHVDRLRVMGHAVTIAAVFLVGNVVLVSYFVRTYHSNPVSVGNIVKEALEDRVL
jgi:hypothetical protein